MKAVVYSQGGGPDVLRLVERPVSDPGPGEVRVRVRVSGVNPTDWKMRYGGSGGELQFGELVPNQDGAGTIDAVGDGVSFDVGASLGIPALTAHRCLTVSELGPRRLEPAALAAQSVLVAGGAGAVGHAAIQL